MSSEKESEFRVCDEKDIKLKLQNIPFANISTHGYSEGVNNRPIRKGHVSRIVASPADKSFDNQIVVMRNEKTGLYYIVDGQHYYEAILELIRKGEREKPDVVKCGVAYRKSTGEIMSTNNRDDRLIALKQGYGMNSGNAKPALGDAINLIYTEGQAILDKLGFDTKNPNTTQLKKMYQVLDKTEFGYRKYAPVIVRRYYNYGKSLTNAGLMEEAQICGWNSEQVAFFHKTGEKPEKMCKDAKDKENSGLEEVKIKLDRKYIEIAILNPEAMTEMLENAIEDRLYNEQFMNKMMNGKEYEDE